MGETRTEWRTVCHGWGQPGHIDHRFTYQNEKQARTMLVKRTEEWARQRSSAMCSPFHLESRQISDWEEVTDDGRANDDDHAQGATNHSGGGTEG